MVSPITPRTLLLIVSLLLLSGFGNAANLTYTPDGSNITVFLPAGDILWVGFVDMTPNSTAWIWNATNITPGNNTPFTFSTDQIVMYGFGGGDWYIELNATTPEGSNSTSGNIFINYLGAVPTPTNPWETPGTGGLKPVVERVDTQILIGMMIILILPLVLVAVFVLLILEGKGKSIDPRLLLGAVIAVLIVVVVFWMVFAINGTG